MEPKTLFHGSSAEYFMSILTSGIKNSENIHDGDVSSHGSHSGEYGNFIYTSDFNFFKEKTFYGYGEGDINFQLNGKKLFDNCPIFQSRSFEDKVVLVYTKNIAPECIEAIHVDKNIEKELLREIKREAKKRNIPVLTH